jgi:copper chaperone CopZ
MTHSAPASGLGPCCLALRALSVLLLLGSVSIGACSRADDRSETVVAAAAPHTVRYRVEGMHCDGCVGAITRKVAAVPGVSACEVSLEGHEATVTMKDASIEAAVLDAIRRLGYKVPDAGAGGDVGADDAADGDASGEHPT